MRSILALAFAAAMAASGPASAQDAPVSDALTLAAGEEAVIGFDDGGRAVTARRGPAAPLNAFDRGALRNLDATGPTKDAIGPNSRALTGADVGAEAPPIAPEAVRISFVSVSDGRATLLVLENGYGRGVAYRARIYRSGRAAPTDVCVVLPERRGYEHWPYPIDRIELSRFRLEAWDGGPPRCE